MKRKIYSASILAIYTANFINNHSKFIHAHPTKLEDLNKVAIIEDKVVKLIGQDDENQGVFLEESTGHFYIGSLKVFKANQLVELEKGEAIEA